MTDEQRFFFDVRGWLLLPAVLSEAECAPIREHLLNGGNGFTGPAQALLDHPAVADVLNETLSESPPAEEYYNFRCQLPPPLKGCGLQQSASRKLTRPSQGRLPPAIGLR
jgi:hypothetical protein